MVNWSLFGLYREKFIVVSVLLSPLFFFFFFLYFSSSSFLLFVNLSFFSKKELSFYFSFFVSFVFFERVFHPSFLFYFLFVFFRCLSPFFKNMEISLLCFLVLQMPFFANFFFLKVFFRIMFPLFVFVTWVFETLLVVFPFVCF